MTSLGKPVLTVRSTLDLAPLAVGQPEVLAGAERLDAPVRWIHIAEGTEMSELLEGGELVLTTGLAFRRDREDPEAAARTFLERFLAAGAAGIVVELVADNDEPDAEAAAVLRRAAAGAAGPVVLLSRRTRFVHVTEHVHRVLVNAQLERVERARRVPEAVTALNLESASEQRIVDRTAELLGSAVVFEDTARRVLSYAPRDADATQLLRDWPERSRLSGYTGRTERAASGEGWLQTPVGLPGQRWGRLVAPELPLPRDPAPGDPAAEGDAVQVLERAGQALTMARMAGRDRREVLHQARSGLLHELRQATPPADAEAVARAASLGLDAADAYVPAVVRLDRAPAEPPTGLQLRERAVLEALDALASRSRQPLLAASLRAGSIAVLLSVPGPALEDSALHRLAGSLSVPGSSWTIGAAPAHRSLVAAARSLDDADQVAETAAALEARDLPFYRFADLRLRGLVALLQDDPRVRAFARAELAPLLDPADEDALALLEQYLRHGGNKASLARGSHLSRQSLYARLAKLEERLGVTLDDAESRAGLTLALLWHRLGRARASR